MELATIPGHLIESVEPKYTTAQLEALPLRSELVIPVAETGPHNLALEVTCSREGARPAVLAPAGLAWIPF